MIQTLYSWRSLSWIKHEHLLNIWIDSKGKKFSLEIVVKEILCSELTDIKSLALSVRSGHRSIGCFGYRIEKFSRCIGISVGHSI